MGPNSSYLSNAAMFHFHEYINLLSQNKIIKICHNLGLRPVVATAARENPKTLGSAAVAENVVRRCDSVVVEFSMKMS